jgi:chromosome segregation ATPase
MEQGDRNEKFKKTTEKLWDSTRRTLNVATFQANKYKRIVQKKIDLSSLHRKISSAHNELGKLIDDIRESGAPEILAKNEVQELFQRLDALKNEAASLEKEIEEIKSEVKHEEEITPEDIAPEKEENDKSDSEKM